MNYYSSPGGGYPQELPERWRFADGSVRYDLPSLTTEQLAILDWVGPISFPVPKTTDENGNVSESYDYDPETHKSVWYKAERRFVIIGINDNETPYIEGTFVGDNGGITDWDGFRTAMVSSVALNTFIASSMSVAPLACLALPATILNIETDGYTKFATTWNAIVSMVDEVPDEVIQEVTGAAQLYNIPQSFIQIITE